jgi:flagellar biosynthesis protein FlhB
MAENDGAERTEKPTAKRLREAREKGQVPRSRELGGAAILGACVLWLNFSGGALLTASAVWLRNALTFDRADLITSDLISHVGAQLIGLGRIFAPLMAVGVIAGAAAPLLVSGFAFSTKSFTPDFSRLNPIAGFKRLYSLPALVEIVKAILRVMVVGGLGWLSLHFNMPALIGLAAENPHAGIVHGGALVANILFALTAGLVAIAAIDVPYQLWQHHHQLRMTREEVREELKESEGRPEVRARIRRTQHALANRRMLEAVPKADAVIVNPTHYAVAIAYDDQMRAPRVVAKGVDVIAEAIRDVAEKHRIPIVSAPPLARALYRQVALSRDIPVQLYAAVAQVLSFVYQLRAYRRHGGRAPQMPRVDLKEEPFDGRE